MIGWSGRRRRTTARRAACATPLTRWVAAVAGPCSLPAVEVAGAAEADRHLRMPAQANDLVVRVLVAAAPIRDGVRRAGRLSGGRHRVLLDGARGAAVVQCSRCSPRRPAPSPAPRHRPRGGRRGRRRYGRRCREAGAGRGPRPGRLVGKPHLAAVRGDGVPDDREAPPGPPARLIPGRLQPVERVEHPRVCCMCAAGDRWSCGWRMVDGCGEVGRQARSASGQRLPGSSFRLK